MTRATTATLVSAALALTGAAGYWFGQRHAGTVAPTPATKPAEQRQVLYYRNPMGLPDTSPTPKKDPMGMDYVPVYADEQDTTPAASNQIRISTDKVQKLGVTTEAASLRMLDKTLRAVGRIEADERRNYTVAAKFEGYLERLYANATGQSVAKGQALFEVYSPELISAQREYAIASQGVHSLKNADSDARNGMQQLASASLARLKNWDISEEQVNALAKSGETRRTLTFRSPVSGIVTEKKAVQGMRFMPGDTLFQITDLSSVWVVADVSEQDIAQVKTGTHARLHIDAYPERTFAGTVSYVYPTLSSETRTVAVRVELPNPGALLKPGMYAQVELPVAAHGTTVTVPISAVIDSGTRRIVLVQAGEGRYEPREVKLGARSDTYVEVIEGVKDGERVVVTANFLIDAESNLKAAISGFGSASAKAATPANVGHHAAGTVDSVDAASGAITISHGAVASLKWPAMTMEFSAANPALLKGLQPGAKIAFEFVERKPGEWVINKIEPQK